MTTAEKVPTFEMRVAGSDWREDVRCQNEREIVDLMTALGISSLTCDTPDGMLEIRQNGEI